jgi:2-hydroxycyclohexanecarboxyl-CoA dehydrogenase
MRTDTPRVALVTGGSRGIGAAIVERLLDDGLSVASLDIVAPEVARNNVLDVRCDLSDAEAVESATAVVRQELGVPSVIVHAAAYQHNALFAELERKDWDRTFRVNVDGAFNLLRSVLPAIRESGWGRIVLLTSASYYSPPVGLSHYIASKAALTGLVRGLSFELGPDGVTINAVGPGLTRTEHALQTVPQEYFDLVLSRQAIPRGGEPEDTAAAVAFLTSNDAGFITGQTVLVDGGESRL